MKYVLVCLLLTIFYILVNCQITEQEKQEIIDRINAVRRNANPTGANLVEVAWSDCLSGIAATYLMNCPTFGVQNPNRQAESIANSCVEQGVSVGETSLNDRTVGVGPTTVDVWASESNSYTYSSNTCATQGACNNYLQLVNAETYIVGCAKHNEVQNCGREGETIICNYAYAPNGDLPYIDGEGCSQCQQEFPDCNDGLCILETATITTPVVSTTSTSMSTEPITTTTTTTTTTATTTTTKATTATTSAPKPTKCRHKHRHHCHHDDGKGKGKGGRHDHKKGHKSHDQNHGDKKHDHAHRHSDQASVGKLAGATTNSSASHNVMFVYLLMSTLLLILLYLL